MEVCVKISITEQALKKFKSDLSKQDTYRVIVKGYGWGGPQFGIVPGEQQTDDYVEDFEGIKISVESMLIETFGGFNIDYSSFWLTKGFYIQALIYGSRC